VHAKYFTDVNVATASQVSQGQSCTVQMIQPAMWKTKAQKTNQVDDGIRWYAQGAGKTELYAPSRACTSSILESVFKPGDEEAKTRRGHMVADTISNHQPSEGP